MNHRVAKARQRSGPRKRGRRCAGCGRIGRRNLFGPYRWWKQDEYTRIWCLDCVPTHTLHSRELSRKMKS